MPLVLFSIGFELGAVDRTGAPDPSNTSKGGKKKKGGKQWVVDEPKIKISLEEQSALEEASKNVDKLLKSLGHVPKKNISLEDSLKKKYTLLFSLLQDQPLDIRLGVFIKNDLSVNDLNRDISVCKEVDFLKNIDAKEHIEYLKSQSILFETMIEFLKSTTNLNKLLDGENYNPSKGIFKEMVEKEIKKLNHFLENKSLRKKLSSRNKNAIDELLSSSEKFIPLLKIYREHCPIVLGETLEKNCEALKKILKDADLASDAAEKTPLLAAPTSYLDFLRNKDMSHKQKFALIDGILTFLGKNYNVVFQWALYLHREEVKNILLKEAQGLYAQKDHAHGDKVMNRLEELEDLWKYIEDVKEQSEKFKNFIDQRLSNPILEEKVEAVIADKSLVKKEGADFVSDESVSWKKVLPDLLKSLNSFQDSNDLEQDLFFIQSHIKKIIACLSEDIRVAKDDALKNDLLEIEGTFKGLETFIPPKYSSDKNIAKNSFDKYVSSIIGILKLFSIIK